MNTKNLFCREVMLGSEFRDVFGWLGKHNVEVVCLNGELSNQEVGRLLRTKQAMQDGAI